MSLRKLKQREFKHEIITILINKTMEKKKLKRDYERPECKVHELQIEKFICTSVYPNAPQSSEDYNWEDGGVVDGGAIEF